MKQRRSWTHLTDLIGTVAVVVSLVYVGLQVRQNTAAIQTSTSQDVYQLHQDRTMIELESPEFAALLVRVERAHSLLKIDVQIQVPPVPQRVDRRDFVGRRYVAPRSGGDTASEA